MGKADTKTKKPETPLQQAPTAQLPAAPSALTLRMPYPKSLGEYADIDQRQWGVLIDAIWPSAKTVEGVCMAISYCKSRGLDPFKKVVHIVPMSVKVKGEDGRDSYREIETVWPGIAEVRITATRTGIYAGKDAAEFGEEFTETFQHVDDRNGEVKKEKAVTYPDWCRVTVYKIVHGVRCAFVGPKVYWKEAYATENRFSDIPNEMWASRTSGQLEKCAEAAALRAAFPEELGGEMTAEEMHGKILDAAVDRSGMAVIPETGEMIPPRPNQSEFQRKFDDQDKKGADKPKPVETAKGGGDPRPEPPAQGEVVAGQGAMHPDDEAEEEEPEDVDGHSAAWEPANEMLVKLGAEIVKAKPDELADYKRAGRTNIDTFEGLTDDERDVLRGQFTTLILTAQKEAAKRGKK